ncbi:MAG: hypothetical protein COW19_00005 [Zetaproteobacteria bacterium CG12_big_fil_rev_8_21_14_0_65_55_1124]|nr:MAG: hypothetical protein AUJ58_09385 [Zetaproteobacteria bacterium CG1_02_55_237]PIS18866.1 MAG: hypothetical protein COT53_08610 [Zetaproteobacteria bacterium CG08_land_8_20_14_0_20_55_17]PIW43995.1 MAG: hypothetical protein COW19_00005 [Zetaproteobacteria bacterium CG12_big_fil_rev_8_21_14_0_65_55_1124]PIY51498.1 MAG: hypothetical protein COZ01_10860 [Zetaproteobacteria bacterium CG_4_10_14_0_8_um_filter_55_43]PIZ40196.1 MAG: hypothetical protein COY36_00285 [Zetaproteobacteria bacterium 
MRTTTQLGLTLMLAFSLAACASVKDFAANVTGGEEPQATSAPGDAKAVPPPVIAEFGDIPIPRELKRQDDQSFIYEAPGTVIGVMVYTGTRIDPNSIGGFFREQMPTQGWRFINAYKDENIDLYYLKDNRSCQISIKAGMMETKVIIKVGPSAAGG